jgi:hypothetical protein
MLRKYLPLLLSCVLVLVVVTGVTAQDSSRDIALDFVSDTYTVPRDDLSVDYELKTWVVGMGRVTRYKMASRSTDAVYGAVVDRTGRAWTPEDFRVAADEAYLRKFGKMDLQLYRRFEEDPNAVIPVAIWIKTDDSLYSGLRGADYVGHGVTTGSEEPPVMDAEGPDLTGPDVDRKAAAAEEAALLAAQQAVEDQVAAVQSSVAARLAAKGINAEAVPQAPILTATLGRDQVIEAGKDPDVIWVYADDIENVDMNDTATVTHRAPAVWSRGYSGVGAKVAILEDSRAYNNFWLVISDTRVPADPNVDSHATQTMGNVGSWHGRFLGMARGATLYSANATTYGSANLMTAANWAVTKGAQIINNSWGPSTPTGCLSSLGRFFDYKVFANARFVTFAAGNSGDLIGDHAMAFNILAVGAFDDKNNNHWGNDTMASYSAWREGTTCSPSNGDREEPDVVATGSNIFSTRMHPPSIDATPVQGTSYSAPMVAGEAALLIDKNSSLTWKPEALRAIIMASALNNIQGGRRLSEYDGAGGIDAYAAYLIVNNGRWLQQTVNPTTWSGTGMNFYAAQGEWIRCAVAWTSHPNSTWTTDPLLTDIDLRLIKPSGGAVAYSSSWNNSYEIIHYTATETGTWQCRAYKYSTTPGTTFEYLGMAVYRNHQQNYNYPF